MVGVAGGSEMMGMVLRNYGLGGLPSPVAPPFHPGDEGGGDVQTGERVLGGGPRLPSECQEKRMWHQNQDPWEL